MNRNNYRAMAVIVVISILVISLMVFSFGCAKKEESKEIKIGAILPLTGDAALYGENAKNAIELAKDEVNNSGGVKGNKITIIYEDSQAKADLAINAANKLINVDHVSVILGGMSSSEVMALAPIMNKSKVVLVSPSATSHEITNAGDYIFRTIVSDIYDGKAMAKFAAQKGYRKAAVLYVTEAGPEGVAKAFAKEFEMLGGKLILSEKSQRGDRDFRSQIVKFKDKNIEIVYFALYPVESELFVRQYRELKIDKPLFTHQLIDDPEVLKKLSNAADGIIFTSPKIAPEAGGEMVKRFYERYQTKYKKEPQNFAPNSYDALVLVAEAMKKYGLKTDEVKQGLYSVKDYHGASGVLSMDKNGDVEQNMTIMVLKGAKAVVYVGKE